MRHDFDLLFVGGGLSAGLAALRLKERRPDLRVGILEAGTLDGRTSPTWSFHEGDLSADNLSFVRPFLSHAWPQYKVRFPRHERVLESRYFSICAEDFYSYVRTELRGSVFEGRRVAEWGAEGLSGEGSYVRTEDGDEWRARYVFDARGWGEDHSEKGAVGYQKFLGLDLELEEPHCESAPTVMDATIPQIDGFRFFYLLPWSENHLLVEDTRYTLDGKVDEVAMRAEVLEYAARKGWKVRKVTRSERGCLLIPFAPASIVVEAGAISWGARAGLFHPTTGYSFLFSIQMAEWLSADPLTPGFEERLELKRATIARKLSFFRWINRMLFWQQPSQRYRLLERFYLLPEATIARFYSARLTVRDYLHIFSGKPPIPTTRAFGVLSEKKKVQFSHVC